MKPQRPWLGLKDTRSVVSFDNIFYSCQHLSLEDKKSLLLKAKKVCKHWWFDELRPDSIRRTPVDISFSEALEYLNQDHLFTVIYRKRPDENVGEIGFSTLNPGNFLWIILSASDFEDFVVDNNLLPKDRP